jgi:uncharacterized repeat protein (TIGR01451 family)
LKEDKVLKLKYFKNGKSESSLDVTIFKLLISLLLFFVCTAPSIVYAEPLVLATTAIPDPVRPGEHIYYTITVSNQGTTQLNNVVITNPAPDYTSVNSSTITDGGVCVGFCSSDGSIKWTLGSLAPGQSRTVQMAAEVSYYSAPPDGTLIHSITSASYDGGSTTTATRDVLVQYLLASRYRCYWIRPPDRQ